MLETERMTPTNKEDAGQMVKIAMNAIDFDAQEIRLYEAFNVIDHPLFPDLTSRILCGLLSLHGYTNTCCPK